MRIRTKRRTPVWRHPTVLAAAAVLAMTCWLMWPMPTVASQIDEGNRRRMAQRTASSGASLRAGSANGGAAAYVGGAEQGAAASLIKWLALTDAIAEGTETAQPAKPALPEGEAALSKVAAADEASFTHPPPLASHSSFGDEAGRDRVGTAAGVMHKSGARTTPARTDGSDSTGSSVGGGSSNSSHRGTNPSTQAGGSLPSSAAAARPAPRCPPLTKQLLQGRARSNTVLLGLVNSMQHDFFLNWLWHLQHTALDYFVVGAVDANTSALLAGMEVPCFDYADEASAQLGIDESMSFGGRGDAGWQRVTLLKVYAVTSIVDWGFNVVFSDMDVIWMRDPLPLFDKHPHADVLFSTDGVGTLNEPGDDGLEASGNMHQNFNTGTYLLRNTPRSVTFVHAWHAAMDTFPTSDQEGLYDLVRVGPVEPHDQDPRLTTAFNKTLWFGIVPPYLFSNAHTYVVQSMHEEKGFQPYSLHLTWTYNGKGGKKARARQAMVWHDEDDYYSSPLSYVTVDLHSIKLPEGYNEWEDSEYMISFHLTSIEAQLFQAYVGMALGAASGRAFISPQFQCYCDTIWYSVNRCRMDDAQGLVFPVTCPTDYVFQPDHFEDDENEFGTPLKFREPGFLDYPQTPEAVKASVVVIRPSERLQCMDCVEEEQGDDGIPVVIVPANLKDGALLELLKPYTKYRVWRLSFKGVWQPQAAFAGFGCAGEAQRFDQRMEHITTEWCCRSYEEAAKYNKQNHISERLWMSNSYYSSRGGLDDTC